MRNLVAHKTREAFDILLSATFSDDRFPNCPDFDALWALCASYVRNLLDYLLNTATVITQREYDDSMAEITVIGRKDSTELLERLYGDIIRRERSTTVKFKLEFGMHEIDYWTTGICRILGIGHHFTEKDIDINSSLSTFVEKYVRTYFKNCLLYTSPSPRDS